MTHRLTSCIALIALSAGPALACPTGADMETGVTITFDDGGFETYRQLRDNLVRMERGYDGAQDSVMDLGLGTFVLSYMDAFDGMPDPSSRTTTAYPGGLASLKVPMAGDRWQATTTVFAGEPYAEEVSVAWGDERTVQIGACSYTAIDGIIAYESDTTIVEGIVYLTDLGIGYLEWFEDDQGREQYTATSITAEG